MRQWYRSENGYMLLSQQRATINVPHIRATAQAMYSDYRTNVAVDDSVFRSEKQ
jgi:hypothetical protein